jgi:hypothetical protein
MSGAMCFQVRDTPFSGACTESADHGSDTIYRAGSP